MLLRLVRRLRCRAGVVRPGVMDRLGVGYEAMREVEPGDRLLRDHRLRAGRAAARPLRPRHELPGAGSGCWPHRRGRRPAGAGGRPDRRPRRRRADGGLRDPRRAARARPLGRGQLVDVSMADGALSWLAMVAARHLADGVVPRRGDLSSAARFVCYRPYAARDGWVTLGALEPKFWAAWCHGVGRADLIEQQFDAPGLEAHREVEAIFASAPARSGRRSRGARLLPGAGARARRGAGLRARARARDGRRPPARDAGEDVAHPGGTGAGLRRAGAGRAHRAGAARSRAVRARRSPRCASRERRSDARRSGRRGRRRAAAARREATACDAAQREARLCRRGPRPAWHSRDRLLRGARRRALPGDRADVRARGSAPSSTPALCFGPPHWPAREDGAAGGHGAGAGHGRDPRAWSPSPSIEVSIP